VVQLIVRAVTKRTLITKVSPARNACGATVPNSKESKVLQMTLVNYNRAMGEAAKSLRDAEKLTSDEVKMWEKLAESGDWPGGEIAAKQIRYIILLIDALDAQAFPDKILEDQSIQKSLRVIADFLESGEPTCMD
jgi:hypothetical protein